MTQVSRIITDASDSWAWSAEGKETRRPRRNTKGPLRVLVPRLSNTAVPLDQ
jgi:hypothetical protein